MSVVGTSKMPYLALVYFYISPGVFFLRVIPSSLLYKTCPGSPFLVRFPLGGQDFLWKHSTKEVFPTVFSIRLPHESFPRKISSEGQDFLRESSSVRVSPGDISPVTVNASSAVVRRLIGCRNFEVCRFNVAGFLDDRLQVVWQRQDSPRCRHVGINS